MGFKDENGDEIAPSGIDVSDNPTHKQMKDDLQDTFQLGIDWTELNDEDLEKAHKVITDHQTRLTVVRQVSRQMDRGELRDVARAVSDEWGLGVVNIFL